MRAVIASQDRIIANRIQAILQDRAWNCVQAESIDADQLADMLKSSKPEMVFVVLKPKTTTSNLRRLRELIEGKMVVVGPADPKIILCVLHKCSADDYVDINDLEPELKSILRRAPGQSPGKLIAVMSPSGGGGSTTLAVNLATIFASKASCALVDLNLSAGDAATMLDLSPKHSVAEYTSNAKRMDSSLFNQLLTEHPSGIKLLAAPLEYEDIPQVTSESVRGAINMARNQFCYVIVDLDHSCSSEQVEVLKLADDILLVFQLDFVSLHKLHRVLDYLVRSGVSRTKIRLVANRYGQAEEIKPTEVESALNMRIEYYLPEDAKDVHRALNVGIPVVVDRPRTKISRSIIDLSTHINGTP